MKRLILLASALLVTIACERNSYETFTSDYKVFFSCDVSQSPYNQLTTPGRFLSVKKGDGVLNITDSDGKNYQEPLSAIQNGSFIFGLAGLIIGTPTFNNDNSSIWAFDLGCPECNSPATRVKFDLQGNASCSKCGGTWSLNTSGFPTDDKSRPLYRYPASFNNGILTVSN
jgi:hypothetical protein